MNANQYPSPEEETPLRDRPIPEIATLLQETLGQQIPAYAIGERDPRRIGVFARGDGMPDEEAEASFRDLAEVVDTLIQGGNSPQVIHSWMIGDNPLLDTAPVLFFHRNKDHQPVVNAAKHIWDSD